MDLSSGTMWIVANDPPSLSERSQESEVRSCEKIEMHAAERRSENSPGQAKRSPGLAVDKIKSPERATEGLLMHTFLSPLLGLYRFVPANRGFAALTPGYYLGAPAGAQFRFFHRFSGVRSQKRNAEEQNPEWRILGRCDRSLHISLTHLVQESFGKYLTRHLRLPGA